MDIKYDDLKAKLESGGSLAITPTDNGSYADFSTPSSVEVPQLPKIEFPMDDLDFQSQIAGTQQDVNKLLSLKDGNGGKVNNFGGSQILINSDRLIFNSRLDYTMIFGQQGIVLSSKGNINLDADDAITAFGENGVFIGVPGKGKSIEDGNGNKKIPKTKADPTVDQNYEPLVLGIKLANLIEDLLITLKNATLLTPVGKGYFREDVMYELACIQARIPEILSTYAYVDGISHEPVSKAPTAPTKVTEPPTTIT